MVVGLSKLINSDASSFILGSSTTPFIVLQPVELLFCVLNEYNGNVNRVYGVDLIRAKILYEKFLRDILELGIRPVFIYNGVREISGNEAARRNYNPQDYNVMPSDFKMYGDFLPCSRIFSINCLRNLGFPFASSVYNWMPSCLGAALILDCPIAAMSSEFCLCSKPNTIPKELQTLTINELKYVKLENHLYEIVKENGENKVMFNFFVSNNSPLKSVKPASRSLIALLMNQQIVTKLPEAIKVEPNDNESFNEAKLRAVIEYVSKTNPIHVLKDIMELSVESGREDLTSKLILSFLRLFCPDFSEASEILRILGMNQKLPTIKAPPTQNRKILDQEAPSATAFFETAAQLLRGGGYENKTQDFLHRWPKALVHMFRVGQLEKMYVASLYDNGVIFHSANSYLIELPHCYGPARVLRSILLSLLVGVEEANGTKYKLIGLKPHVKEVCYEGMFRFKTYNVHIRPLYLPSGCSTDDFLYTHLGFTPSPHIPEWSIALIISCLLWHQQSEKHQNCRIRDCPLILATLLLANITQAISDSDISIIADHFDDLKQVVRGELSKLNALPSPALEKEYYHAVLELMNLYTNYTTLSNLLTVIQNPNVIPDFKSPEYNRFPQIHAIFPSLELLVNIACHLKTQESPFNTAQRMWLVKAFRTQSNDFSSIKTLQQIVSGFSSLTDQLSTMKLNFKAPEYTISDPPNCLLPKEERKPAKSNSAKAQENRVPFKPRGNSGGKIQTPNRPQSNPNSSKNTTKIRHNNKSRRPNKSGGSYGDKLTKRFGEMDLNNNQ